MEKAYHSTSHMKCGFDLPTDKRRMSVTVRDLNLWAEKYAARYEVALYRNNPVVIRTIEANMKALADYANVLAGG